MIEIKDLLSKFGKILLSEEGKREFVCQAISESINIPLKKEDIEVKGSDVYLNIKPIYKNEIFFKQKEILDKLEDFFKCKNVKLR